MEVYAEWVEELFTIPRLRFSFILIQDVMPSLQTMFSVRLAHIQVHSFGWKLPSATQWVVMTEVFHDEATIHLKATKTPWTGSYCGVSRRALAKSSKIERASSSRQDVEPNTVSRRVCFAGC